MTAAQRRPIEMAADEILRQLTYASGLPRAALEAASSRRAEMVPLFLAEIERYVAASAAERDQPTPLFFIFHLLGEWREQSAYRPLARLLRCDSDAIDFAIGDATTINSHRVMAAVFDGDPQPLREIVLDADADEFIRSRMIETLVVLVLDGRLPRTEAENFLRQCFTAIRPQGTCFVWNGWQQSVAHLGISDMTSLVREAFDKEFIDPRSTELRHFERDLRRALEHPGAPYDRPDEYTIFGDIIEELSRWHGFTEEYARERKRLAKALQQTASLFDPREPVVNLFPKVGRNAPCPCGSVKKFKKCCLQ